MMKARKWTLTLLAVLALGCLGWGNPGVSLVEEGNRLFAEGDFEGALERYNEALLELPEAREILYNIGGVRHRQGDLENAAALYKSVLESEEPELAARAAYNLGNNLFRQEDYSRAAEAYKAALKLEPEDEDARYNYELARRFALQPPPPQPEPQEQEQKEEEEEEKQDQGQPPPKPEEQEEDAEEEESKSQAPSPEDETGEEPPPPPPEEGEMDPEDVERLLDAMLSEEEDQRAEMREKEQGDMEEVGKDW
ncbi:MAG: tetratricopeptide repeat protein [Candidatus Erginobacter occultus]|nr:tetratricopeptide repeat protein [Candidatus Erginobacter occultus]